MNTKKHYNIKGTTVVKPKKLLTCPNEKCIMYGCPMTIKQCHICGTKIDEVECE